MQKLHLLFKCSAACLILYCASVAAKWEEVSLTDTADFDVNCRYRVDLCGKSSMDRRCWFYPAETLSKQLRTIYEGTLSSYVTADNKTTYIITAVSMPSKVYKLEKNCEPDEFSENNV